MTNSEIEDRLAKIESEIGTLEERLESLITEEESLTRLLDIEGVEF